MAIKRAIIIIQGVHFDQAKSKRSAKVRIPVLICLIIAGHVHEILYRRLLDDQINDEKRIWCVVDYTIHLQNYNLVINIVPFCASFLINLLSAIIIIVQATRLRANVQKKDMYRQILREQFRQHKQLLIAPSILVVLAIPRLIISFVSGCMETTADTWLSLVEYFTSFIPPTLIFLAFVIPSQTYKQEFYDVFRRYQRSLQAHFRLLCEESFCKIDEMVIHENTSDDCMLIMNEFHPSMNIRSNKKKKVLY